MTTNFGTEIAITGFVWTITTKQLVMKGGLSGRPTKCSIAVGLPCNYKGLCHSNHFCLSICGVYIGATWWIRLNRPCAAAMRPYVKLLWPLFIIIIIRPHCSTTYVYAACGYRPGSVVCRSVSHSREPCKTAEPIEMSFVLWTRVAPSKRVYLMGVHIGATWRIPLNGPCAAAMRPYVKSLWPVVIIDGILIPEYCCCCCCLWAVIY